MYSTLLTVHSYVRWIVLLVALLVIVRAAIGVAQRRPWTPSDDAAARWFGMSIDIQMVIGLIIYFFLSPFTMSAWRDIGGAMRDAGVRFVVIEHQVGMLIAVALAHIGRVRIRKATDGA